MAEVNKLTIKVATNAKKATADLEKLSKVAKQLSQNSEQLQGMAKEVKKSGEAASKSASGFAKLLKSIGRVAFYRAIRAAISGVTKALKEGVSNFQEWDAANNGISGASATMAQYSATLTQVKNSLGAAIMPLLQAVLPTVQQLASWFITLVNAVNQVFSALSGKSTYWRATEVSATVADNLDSASGSAKELKNTLMGFDELNVLNGNSSSGGGSSASTSGNQGGFEEAAIDSKFSGVVSYISEAIQKVKDAWNELVGAFINSGLNDVVSRLVENFVKLTAHGVSEVATDLMNLVSALIRLDGIGIIDALNDLVIDTTLLPVTGITQIFDALFDTNVTGWIEDAVSSLKNLFSPKKSNYIGSQTQKDLYNLQNKLEEMQSDAELTRDKIKELGNGISTEDEAKLNRALELIEEIFDMDQYDNKTQAQIDIINYKINELNALGLDGVELHFDEATQHIVETKEQITATIEELKRQYELEAYREDIIEAYKLQHDAEAKLAEATVILTDLNNKKIAVENKLATSNERLAEISNELLEIEKQKLTLGKEDGKQMDELNAKMMALQEEQRALKGDVADYNEELKDTQDAMYDAAVVANTYKGAVSDAKNKVGELTDGLNKMYEASVKSKEEMAQLAEATAKVYGGKVTIENSSSRRVSGMTYANGGFVDEGQMFVAREAGPELVGTIGNRTAVVNNNDIVAAVSQGVASAVSGVIGNGASGGQNIQLNVDGKNLFDIIVNRNNGYVRSTGASPLLV